MEPGPSEFQVKGADSPVKSVSSIKMDLTGFKPLVITTQVIGALILTLILVWVFGYAGGFGWRSYPGLEFNWHPFLMVLSLVVLYSQSILTYRILREKRKRHLKVIHAAIHGVAFVLAIIGLIAVFDSHNFADPPTPNLYSLHSWIGLLTVALFLCQFLAGFVSFMYPVTSLANRQSYMPVHVYFGLSGFVLACLSCLIGITEKLIFKYGGKYGQLPEESVVLNFVGILIMIYGFLVCYLATKPEYKRLATDEEDHLLHSN